MSSAVVLAIITAILAVCGLFLIVLWLIPARPALSYAMSRMAPVGAPDAVTEEITRAVGDMSWLQRRVAQVGHRFYTPVTSLSFVTVPKADLAVLEKPAAEFIGEKLAAAAIGFVFPIVANALWGLSGAEPLPWSMPGIVSLILAVVLFIAPDREIRARAAAARDEFRRTLGIYIDIVAMVQRSGVGGTQALEQAALVGDSWVVRRIGSTLQEAARAGKRPWNALKRLSSDLELKDLADVADIMTLGSEHGTQIIDSLRAKARSLRNAMVTEAAGNESSKTKQLAIPLALLGVLFLIILIIPGLSQLAAT